MSSYIWGEQTFGFWTLWTFGDLLPACKCFGISKKGNLHTAVLEEEEEEEDETSP